MFGVERKLKLGRNLFGEFVVVVVVVVAVVAVVVAVVVVVAAGDAVVGAAAAAAAAVCAYGAWTLLGIGQYMGGPFAGTPGYRNWPPFDIRMMSFCFWELPLLW